MLVDSHCHLDFAVFDTDRHHVLQQCFEQGIGHILIPGTQQAYWQRQIQLKRQYTAQLNIPKISIALGLHPYFLADYHPQHLQQLQQYFAMQGNDIIAVGEIGLDAVIDVPMSLQIDVFEQQLDMAQALKKPVILHHRKSQPLILQSLKRCHFEQGGVLHGFSGNRQQAQAFIDRGFVLGIGGTISYPRANKTRSAVSELPLANLLLETDAPDMPLMGYQGQRNTPLRLPQVLQQIACLRNQPSELIARVTTENFLRVFKLN